MSRPLRIEYKNAFYHVMNRGRRKESIFFDDGDRYLFLSVLAETVMLFKIKIYAYCLMGNHYHLLLSTPEANISRAMRHINGVYTQKINRKHKIDGSVFRGRYKGILINAEEYFVKCLKYIHRNPIKGGVEKELGEYKWTSYKEYFIKDTKRKNKWLCIDEALSFFDSYKKVALEAYDVVMKQKSFDKVNKRLDGTNWPAVLGDEEFKKRIKEKILGKDLSEIDSSSVRESLPANTYDEAVNVFKNYLCAQEKNLCKEQKINFMARGFAIRYCREKLNYTTVEIAKNAGLSRITISREYFKFKKNNKYDDIMENGCYK